MRRLAWLGVAAVGLALLGAPSAQAEPAGEQQVETNLQAFLQMVFWPSNQFGNTAAALGVKKPAIEKLGPTVRVRISASGYDSFARDVLRKEAALTGLDFVFLADDDRSETMFIEIAHYTDGTTPSDVKTCDTLINTGAQGQPRLHIIMDPLKTIATMKKGGAAFMGCVNRQTMKALGFGYDHDHPTVLSFAYSNWFITDLDKTMMRTLYDPRVKPGMHWLGALATARDVVVANMIADGATAATADMGRRWVARFTDTLLAKAEAGDVMFQTQLAFAYSGEAEAYLPKNLAAAYDWFRRAADAGDLEAQAQVGSALVNGRGVAPDIEEGTRWLRLAAGRGHPDAVRDLALIENKFVVLPPKPANPYQP